MTSEHNKETAFLRHCIRYDDSAKRHRLEDAITRIQRDESCLRRAMWLMALLGALAVAGLGYGVVFVENVFYNTSQLIIAIIGAVGVGSLFCLMVFVVLGIAYRYNLDQQREECRQLVTRLLDSRLGKPVTPPLRNPLAGDRNDETVQVTARGNSSLDQAASMIQV